MYNQGLQGRELYLALAIPDLTFWQVYIRQMEGSSPGSAHVLEVGLSAKGLEKQFNFNQGVHDAMNKLLSQKEQNE